MKETNIKVLDSKKIFDGTLVSSMKYFQQTIPFHYLENSSDIKIKVILRWTEYSQDISDKILRELTEVEFKSISEIKSKEKFNQDFQKKILSDIINYLFHNESFEFSDNISMKLLKN